MAKLIKNSIFKLSDLIDKFIFIFISLCFISSHALADSAAAWKAYQEGKNPVAEFLILFLGIAIFLVILIWLNKLNDKKGKKKAKK